MRLELGAQVRTSDGEDIGEIEKLIIEPESGEVTAAVVRKGALLPEDVSIPLAAFAHGGDDHVRINFSAAEVDSLPRYLPDNYRQPLPDYRSPFGYPAAGLLWPATTYPALGLDYVHGAGADPSPDYDQVRSHIDDTTVVIEEGSDVLSRDGEKVGEVHSVSVDATSGRPTRFVVRKGFVFTEDLELPMSLVETIGDDAVHLNVDKDEVSSAARSVETNLPKTVL